MEIWQQSQACILLHIVPCMLYSLTASNKEHHHPVQLTGPANTSCQLSENGLHASAIIIAGIRLQYAKDSRCPLDMKSMKNRQTTRKEAAS